MVRHQSRPRGSARCSFRAVSAQWETSLRFRRGHQTAPLPIDSDIEPGGVIIVCSPPVMKLGFRQPAIAIVARM
jgi:hypothetical protein